jgi:hypothetical protein
MVRHDPSQGSVPPIEDEVEKNYHGGVLSDVSYFTGLMMVGLMSAARPPTLPARDEAHDPARVLSDEQEQQRRRISLVSPSGAAHYVAMHEVVAQHASRSTPVNDLFHQARELISAVAQQVEPVADLVAKARDLELEEKPANEGDAWRRRVIATTLGLEEHIVGVWQSLSLHKYAHRDRVHGVRRLTQNLVDEAFQAVVVVMALIDAYERHFELVLDRIADLRNGEPTTAAAKALRDLMPYDPRCMAYLFDELQDPRWWPLLRKRRFFDSPPEPERLVHPVWPASRYLARIAANAPDRTAFVELLLKIGADTANVRIHEDIVRSAIGLPSEQACLVLDAAVAWLRQPLHGDVARLVGSRELIRFPTWLAQLSLRIATDVQSPLDHQQRGRATLADLLAWEVDPVHSDVCFPRGIESGAFTAVVQHLLQYVDAQAWELVLQILIEAAQHVSETLRTIASELSDPLYTDPDEKLGGASALAEAVVWITDPQDPLRDGSEALAPGDLYGAIAAMPADPFGFTLPPCGIAVLVRALVMLAVKPPVDRPDLRARARALMGASSPPLALMQRVRAFLLAVDADSSVEEVVDVLMDPALRNSPSVRADYTALLLIAWARLPQEAQSRVRSQTLTVAMGGAHTARSALAPLALVDDDMSVQSAWSDSRQEWVRQNPSAEALFDHLAYIYRGGCSLEQRPEPLHRDPNWVTDDVTGIRIHVDHVRDRERGNWLAPPSSDPVPLRVTELRQGDNRLTRQEWAEATRALKDCALVFGEVPSPEGRTARRTAVAWLNLLRDDVLSGGTPTVRQVRALHRELRRRPFAHRAIVVDTHRLPASRDSLGYLSRQPSYAAIDLSIALLLSELPDRERKRILTTLLAALRAGGLAAPALWQLVGLYAPALYSRDRTIFAELTAALGPTHPQDVTVSDRRDRTANGWDDGRATHLAAYVSGLLILRRPLSAEFCGAHRDLLKWFFRHIHDLPYTDSLDPRDISVVLAACLLNDGAVPGGASTELMEAIPPPGVVSALQLIFRSERSKPAQPEERRYFQELWNHVREWIDRDSARTVVLAVMSAWAAQRACRETLGAAFVVQQLRECLAVHTSVYDVNQLLVALTEMIGGQPDVADDVLAYAIDLRDAGLLLNCPPRYALALVAALESQLGTARVGRLRNVLTADKVIDPLARQMT